MMRSKKKRLRRQTTLRPATKDEMVEAMQAAHGGPGGWARLTEYPPASLLHGTSDQLTTLPMTILPYAPMFFQVDQSPEAKAHYDAIDEGLAVKP